MADMDKEFILDQEFFNSEHYIVDIQGYTFEYLDHESNDYKNDFIIKEVSFVSYKKTAIPTCYVIKPPNSVGEIDRKWEVYSGISWDDGEVPYDRLERLFEICTRNVGVIYTKGADKINIMKKFLPKMSFVNVDRCGCPDLGFIERYEPFNCLNHSLPRRPVCAQKNVLTIRSWLWDYYSHNIGRDIPDNYYCYLSE